MIGRSPGNGHPYSWSAICNGYDADEMAKLTEFSAIPQYLAAAPAGEFGVGDVRVTHLWMPDPAEAAFCARCAKIPHVVSRPEDVIGHVDAVVIPTDAGETHRTAAEPFLRAGVPLFIDKPLCLTVEDLEFFAEARRRGAKLMSCSSARFCPEFLAARAGGEFGEIKSVNATVPHRWETYGIHAVEALYLFFGPTAAKVTTLGTRDRSVTAIEYPDGAVATVSCTEGGFPGLWIEINGRQRTGQVRWTNSFMAFRDTLRAFHHYLATGEEPFPFAETVDLMRIIAAGILSRGRGGRTLRLPDMLE